MSRLLLEIFTEEISYSLQKKIHDDFYNVWQELLITNNISFNNISVYSTAVRLVLDIDGLPDVIDDNYEEKKGPSTTANEKAIAGFLKTYNLTLEQCVVKTTEKGDFYFFNLITKGGTLQNILPKIIQQSLSGLSFKRSMKWHSCGSVWARPVRNVLAVYEDTSLHLLDVNIFGLKANKSICGHYFMGQKNYEINSINDYFTFLEANYVVLDFEKRKNIIIEQSTAVANKHNLEVHKNQPLLDELAYLTEYPVLYTGTIPSKYMNLPHELMVNVLVKNQRYINLYQLDGSLSNKFIIVSNLLTPSNGQEIILGNEKVLVARLEDGLFFYENDLKNPLIDKVNELEKINFFEGLGSIYDKKERVKDLFINVFKENQELLCDLYKNDLLSYTVFEIPELQGIMGSYHALHDGVDVDIAMAIKDHYKPQGNNESVPSTILGGKLALLDKLDTLIEFFRIGKKPTGSKDPFALRRSALGVIRIILHYEIEINLDDFLELDLSNFIMDRFIVYLKDKGYNYSLINAVLMKNKEFNIIKIYKVILLFTDLLKQPEVVKIMQLYKRADNILNAENVVEKQLLRKDLLESEHDKSLYEVLASSGKIIKDYISYNNYAQAITESLVISKVLDNFLDNVIINQSENSEIKANRFALLQEVLLVLNNILPFSNIEL